MKNRNITLADSNAPVPPSSFDHYMDVDEDINMISRPAATLTPKTLSCEQNGINLNFTKLIPNHPK